MYKTIYPIICTNYYKLDLHNKNYTNLKNTINFMQTLNDEEDLDSKKILKFIKYNYDCLNFIIKLLPFPKILYLYQKFNFCENYWTFDLLDYLLKKNKFRISTHLLQNKDPSSFMIKLNNQINQIYNFSDKIFKKKLVNLEIFKFIKLEEFYLSTNLILFLVSKSSNLENFIFKFYPKTKFVSFKNNNLDIYTSFNNEFIIKIGKFTLIIDSYYYQNNYEILNFTNEKIIYDWEHFVTLPEFYQRLEDPVDNNFIEYKYDYDNNIKFLFPRKIVKKYIPKNFLVLQKCYICKNFIDPEFTIEDYNLLCTNCGLFNLEKKLSTSDLNSCVAFVSGIRQKIGLQIALKLLRNGAKVIGTTRFLYGTLYNFKKNKDFDDWKDKLIIYECNFINMEEVNNLINFLQSQNINILINNACQTIKPSDFYFNKMMELEKILRKNIKISDNSNNLTFENKNNLMITNLDNKIMLGTNPKTIINCIQNIELNFEVINNIILDKKIIINKFNDIQDKNIKKKSSWTKNIEEIDKNEILEASIINQIVPTLLINSLKKKMNNPKFIINVTALEGQFETNKTSSHAHTNMNKAAINMLIRTLFEEKDSNLNVYAIDPGLVSSVNPQNMEYPLSDKDGASRILDPIIQYYNGNPLPREWVKLRNYIPEKW